ncbi:hypothetical protein BASA81_008814 [Batrachochytrium salamandrivorans]|nr:hypothetical protein BASA81_008814 [Batrachochytrium salamandrivorans]
MSSTFGLSASQQIKRAREYVPRWSSHSPDLFESKPLSGGLTNILSTVSLVRASPEAEEETAVLFRQNGQNTSLLINRKQEDKVIEFLSKVGLYPKVYAQLEWGSIQTYLAGYRALTPQEYRSAKFMSTIGSLLGQMHGRKGMLIEACVAPGEGSTLPNRLDTWMSLARSVSFPPSHRQHCLKLAALDLAALQAEVAWLVNTALPRVKSKIVLAHCDLQPGNVMWNPETDMVKMIDLEYADRMERGFDLGNCFCEMTLNYNVAGCPGFVLNPDYYPTDKDQDLFLEAYCQGAGLDFALNREQLKREAQTFALAIWITRCNACTNTGPRRRK